MFLVRACRARMMYIRGAISVLGSTSLVLCRGIVFHVGLEFEAGVQLGRVFLIF